MKKIRFTIAAACLTMALAVCLSSCISVKDALSPLNCEIMLPAQLVTTYDANGKADKTLAPVLMTGDGKVVTDVAFEYTASEGSVQIVDGVIKLSDKTLTSFTVTVTERNSHAKKDVFIILSK